MNAAQTGKRPFSHFRNESFVTNRKWTPRPGFIFNRFHTTFESCIPPEYLCTRKTIIPIHLSHHFHSLSCSSPEFKTEFNVRSLLHAAVTTSSLPAQHGAVFPVMLSVGRCGVARLQMKFGHTDGMHCIIDVTSMFVKIKSVALYNCQTVF